VYDGLSSHLLQELLLIEENVGNNVVFLSQIDSTVESSLLNVVADDVGVKIDVDLPPRSVNY
jgi:hypothetical protein